MITNSAPQTSLRAPHSISTSPATCSPTDGAPKTNSPSKADKALLTHIDTSAKPTPGAKIEPSSATTLQSPGSVSNISNIKPSNDFSPTISTVSTLVQLPQDIHLQKSHNMTSLDSNSLTLDRHLSITSNEQQLELGEQQLTRAINLAQADPHLLTEHIDTFNLAIMNYDQKHQLAEIFAENNQWALVRSMDKFELTTNDQLNFAERVYKKEPYHLANSMHRFDHLSPEHKFHFGELIAQKDPALLAENMGKFDLPSMTHQQRLEIITLTAEEFSNENMDEIGLDSMDNKQLFETVKIITEKNLYYLTWNAHKINLEPNQYQSLAKKALGAYFPNESSTEKEDYHQENGISKNIFIRYLQVMSMLIEVNPELKETPKELQASIQNIVYSPNEDQFEFSLTALINTKQPDSSFCVNT